jgi:hypothetical protein
MKTCETPSTEVERSSSIPLIVLTAPSTLSVISVSISCGDAPGLTTVTVIVGRSIFGKEIDAQRLVGEEPDDRQTQDQHRREHRTPNTNFS